MRFMMIMIPSPKAQEDWSPKPEDVKAMSRYNDQLKEAGVLLTLDGLQETGKGARVGFAGGKPRVTDGPFPEAKEVIGGYWMIDVPSKEEAVTWATRCPGADGDTIEVRQVYEMTDFPPEVQAAAAG
ncbi:MAG: YciI family protein [Solirubrobacteraceae bacterium]